MFLFLRPLFYIPLIFFVKGAFALDQGGLSESHIETEFGSGFLKNADGTQSALMHGVLSFTAYDPLEKSLNSKTQFTGTFVTQTPLREEDAYVNYPFTDHDIVEIGELYVKHQWNPHFSTTVGVFSDTPDPTVPRYWPFYGVGLEFLALDSRLQISVRGDRFAAFSYTSGSSQSSVVNREKIQVRWNQGAEGWGSQWSFSSSFYEDPDAILSSLSVGRDEYIEYNTASKSQLYHFGEASQRSFWNVTPWEQFAFEAKYWRNWMAEAFGQGFFWELESLSTWKKAAMSLSYGVFDCQQNALPSVALSSFYYPGFRIFSWKARASYVFEAGFEFGASFVQQAYEASGQASAPSPNPGSIPLIPSRKVEFVFKKSYDF